MALGLEGAVDVSNKLCSCESEAEVAPVMALMVGSFPASIVEIGT